MDTKQTTERLKSAIANGEILTIVYHGGSQAGTKRDIAPIKVVEEEGEVKARDISTGKNTPKTFSIEKIQIVSKNFKARQYNPEKSKAKKTDSIRTLEEGFVEIKKELGPLGWLVQMKGQTIEGYIGEVKEKPDILLSPEDSLEIVISVFGGDSTEEEKPTGNWVVEEALWQEVIENGESSMEYMPDEHTYSNLYKAVQRFVRLGKERA